MARSTPSLALQQHYTSRRLQQAANSTLVVPSSQQQLSPPSPLPGSNTIGNGSMRRNSSAAFVGAPGPAPGGPTGNETECLPGHVAANCTGIPSGQSADKQGTEASPPPLDAADAAPTGPSDAASAMLLPSPIPEAVPDASPEGYLPLPGGIARTYRPPPPARASKTPAPAPQGGGSGTPGSDASGESPDGPPVPPADHQPEGGSGSDGNDSGKLQGWLVAVIAALAASLAVLAGVAGYYGVKKRRNRHKQFKRYMSAHVARLSDTSGGGGSGSGAGTGEPLGKLPLSSWASHSLPFSSTGSNEAPVSALWPAGGLAAIELGPLHVTSSKQELLGVGSGCASAATAQADSDSGSGAWGAGWGSEPQGWGSTAQQAQHLQGWGVGRIPAAYPAGTAAPGAGCSPAASWLGPPAAKLWLGGLRQLPSGIAQPSADEATPMDEEGHLSQPAIGTPSDHYSNPLLLGATHSLGSPPHPGTPSGSQQLYGQRDPSSDSQPLEEPEPMDLESLGGPVVVTNPWAGLLPQQASHAQQQQQHGMQHPQQQGQLAGWLRPQPTQQQLDLGAPEVPASNSSAATAAGSALDWSYFWDAASGAGRTAAAVPGAQPQSAPQQPLSLSPAQKPPWLRMSGASLEDCAGSGADSDATSPLREGAMGGAARLSTKSKGAKGGAACLSTKSKGDSGDGAAALQLSSALGESDGDINPDDIQICKRPDGTDWQLGAGAFGKVYKALRGGVSDVAVKVLLADASEDEDFRREVAILRSCRDSHVVQFLGACLRPGLTMLVTEFMGRDVFLGACLRPGLTMLVTEFMGRDVFLGACLRPGRTMLVTEFMGGGDLRAALSRHPGAFRWGAGGRGRALALDIARGLHYLHARRIIHFDLKSNNILLSQDGTVAKIADVGLAAIVSHKYVSLTGLRGAFAWAAPEVLMGERHCSEKADIYSLGVVLWELVTCEVPQRGRMREPRVPEECPAEVALLIDRCLAVSPSSRPSAKEAFLSIQASPKTAAPARA
ncbi:hypothetical protein N2152v2_001595 [Parachlorella kessleri]